MLLDDLRRILTGTARVWWRLLPRLTAIYLAGWVGSQVATTVAVLAGDVSPWLALVVFALSFLCQLVAIVIVLRLLGSELGIDALLAEAPGLPADERPPRLSQLLAVTLLPFLALWAGFGHVNEAANELATQQFVRYGIGSDQPSVLGLLTTLATDHPWRLLGIVVTLYVFRRLLDLWHDRTGWRVAGLAVTFVEAFFLLLMIMGGIRVFQEFQLWFADRAVVGWLAVLVSPLISLASLIRFDLPAAWLSLLDWWSTQAWPVLWDVVSQPVVWLAVVAVVYGSRAWSLAEFWRVTGSGRVGRIRDRLRRRRTTTAGEAGSDGPAAGIRAPRTVVPTGLQRAGGELRGAFLGDIDDKYLPTLHALRLILRAGWGFLAAVIIAYGVLDIVLQYVDRALHAAIGGHDVEFWIAYAPLVSLPGVLLEPIRLTLLAVAFRLCLVRLRDRAAALARDTAAVPADGGDDRPAELTSTGTAVAR